MARRKSKAPAAADADAAAAADAVPWKNWVECPRCKRWRGAPDDVDGKTLVDPQYLPM